MAWIYAGLPWQTYSAQMADEVLKKLNTLSKTEAASAKVMISDQDNGDAKGGIFYYEGAWTTPARHAGKWTKKSWSSSSNSDYAPFTQKVLDYLNSLPLEVTLTAHIASKDARGSTFQFVVWTQQN